MGGYTLRASSSQMSYGTSYSTNRFTWSGVTDPGESWTFGITWTSGNYSGTIQSRSSSDMVTWNPTADNACNQLMADKLTAAVYVTGTAYNNGSPASSTNITITLKDMGNRKILMTVGDLSWTLDGTTDPIGLSNNQMLAGYGYGQTTVTFAKQYNWDLGTYTYPNGVRIVDKYTNVQLANINRIVNTDNYRGTAGRLDATATCVYSAYCTRQLSDSSLGQNVEATSAKEVEIVYYEPPSVDSYSADRNNTTINCEMTYSIFSIGSNAVQSTQIEFNGTTVSGTTATFTLPVNQSKPCYFRVTDKITTTEVVKLVPTLQMPISVFDDTLGNSATSFGEMCLDYNTKDSVSYPNIINLAKDTQFRLTPSSGNSQIYVNAHDALNYKELFRNGFNHSAMLWEMNHQDISIATSSGLNASTIRVYYNYHEKLNMLEIAFTGTGSYSSDISLSLKRNTGDSSTSFSSFMNTVPNVTFDTSVFTNSSGTRIGTYQCGTLGGTSAFKMDSLSSNKFQNIVIANMNFSYWVWASDGHLEFDIVGQWRTSDATKTSYTLTFPPVYAQIWLGW